jgi:hypothetical protein
MSGSASLRCRSTKATPTAIPDLFDGGAHVDPADLPGDPGHGVGADDPGGDGVGDPPPAADEDTRPGARDETQEAR